MGREERVNYWVNIADYDYETALALMETKRYLYVAFMCHQVIEKLLKAYWSKVLDEPPLKIHTLSRLAEISGILSMMTQEQIDFILNIQPMNIESRYPEYMQELIKGLNMNVCQHYLDETEKFRTWIKEKL